MWAIIGLGNPGARYAHTRHNVGFAALEELCRAAGLQLSEKSAYMIARGSIEGEKAVLVEPLTFMNLSGQAVSDVMRRNPLEPANLIVVHDDIDLPTGALRVRSGGSSGGHKGVESIIQSLGTREFIRVRIGVGRDGSQDVKDFVLSKFRPEEKVLVGEAVSLACDAVRTIISRGLQAAMNSHNRRPKPPKAPKPEEQG